MLVFCVKSQVPSIYGCSMLNGLNTVALADVDAPSSNDPPMPLSYHV